MFTHVKEAWRVLTNKTPSIVIDGKKYKSYAEWWVVMYKEQNPIWGVNVNTINYQAFVKEMVTNGKLRQIIKDAIDEPIRREKK